MIARRTLLTAVAGVASVAGAVVPAASQTTPMSGGAARFIRDLSVQVVDLLAKRERDVQRFHDLLYLGFDVPYIARFVLGRYWNVATAGQREEYQRLFTGMIIKIYSDRFSLYAGETLKIVGSRQDSTVDAIVSSQIGRPSGPPINVDWRVRNRNRDYKIIDVAVEGVSLGVVQREEFSSVIQRGGGNVDALLSDAQRVATARPRTAGALRGCEAVLRARARYLEPGQAMALACRLGQRLGRAGNRSVIPQGNTILVTMSGSQPTRAVVLAPPPK